MRDADLGGWGFIANAIVPIPYILIWSSFELALGQFHYRQGYFNDLSFRNEERNQGLANLLISNKFCQIFDKDLEISLMCPRFLLFFFQFTSST